MSTAILPTFFFGDSPVRPAWHEGDPWFVAKDVCAALEISNSRDALAKLDDDEKGVALTDTPGGKQEMAIVSVPGAYRLVFSSRKPSAEKFKRWLSHEVIPAIMKTGRYEAARVERQVTRDDGRNQQRVRYAKLALVNVAMRLEELGVTASAIDMAAVVRFGRSLQTL